MSLRPLALAPLLLGACGGDGTSTGSGDGDAAAPAADALPLGTTQEIQAGDATVELSVDDIRAATEEEVADHGLQPADDQVLWFVTYTIALTEGEISDLDPAVVYPADEDWTGVTDRGGEVKQTQVIGAGFDCTRDGSATQGIAVDAPFVDCLVFQTGPDATLESVTVGEHGTWSGGA